MTNNLLNVLWAPEPVDPRGWNALGQQPVAAITTAVEGLTVVAVVVVVRPNSSNRININSKAIRQSYPCNRPWRPVGL
jgi:hypothetical protein